MRFLDDVVPECSADDQPTRSLSSPTAQVIRGGQTVTIRSADIVPGDVVEVKTGDTVPADIRIIEAMSKFDQRHHCLSFAY